MELITANLFTDPTLSYYCRFEGNSNDSKGSNNGVDTSITYSSTNGKYGQGAGFNGTTSKIAIADNNALDLDTGDFSITCWVNLVAKTNTRHIISKLVDGSNYYELRVSSSGDGIVSFDSYATARKCQVIGTTSLSTATWYFIAVVVDRDSAANTKIYLNAVNDTAGTPTVSTDTIANAAALWFGADQFGGGGNFYSGAVDDLATFKGKALSQAEVTQLFIEQSGLNIALEL